MASEKEVKDIGDIVDVKKEAGEEWIEKGIAEPVEEKKSSSKKGGQKKGDS